jgi:hypothetical protein
LVVIENLRRVGPPEAASRVARLDLQMLAYYGQARQRSEEELRELFLAADFELTAVVSTPYVDIVEGRPLTARRGSTPPGHRKPQNQ